MGIESLIGSILVLNREAITDKELRKIRKYLEKEYIGLRDYCTDIPSLVYTLRNYGSYFYLCYNKISISKEYTDKRNILKRIFFDNLGNKDKLIIYNIINIL